MKYGFCLPGGSFMPQGVAEVRTPFRILTDGYDTVMNAGFDYAESSVGLITNLSDEELDRAAALHEEGRLIITAANSLIPRPLRVTGDGADSKALRDFINATFAKLRRVGVKIVVFGSGGARSVPEGYSRGKARGQIMDFLAICAEAGEKFGLTLVIEPLCKKECNILNTAAECLEYVRRAASPRVKLLVDAYHMNAEDEPFSVLHDAADELVHVHIAEPVCRRYPGFEGGEYVRAFLCELEKIGYKGGATVECGMKDPADEIPKAAAFLGLVPKS